MSSPSFLYSRASEVSDALIQGSRAGTAFVAGGTDLLQLWKAGVIAPEGVVDISRLPLDDIEFADSQLSLGALARLSTEHAAYRWLCGGVSVNHHLLSDFRSGHRAALDELLAAAEAAPAPEAPEAAAQSNA